MLYGTGNNGKSELLRLLRALFPPSTVASLPPQEWGERFKVARLVGVLANFVHEIPERDIASGEVFKGVITGDPVSAERKNRDPFEYHPVAGHIFSANSLPGTVDQSEGYWRRFALCPFTRDFATATTRKIDAAQDVLNHELAGLAAWALRGAPPDFRTRAPTFEHVGRRQQRCRTNGATIPIPIRRFLHDRPKVEMIPSLSPLRAVAILGAVQRIRGHEFNEKVRTTCHGDESLQACRREGARFYTRKLEVAS